MFACCETDDTAVNSVTDYMSELLYCTSANKLSHQFLEIQIRELCLFGHVDEGKMHRNSGSRYFGQKPQ
jgi:hypothetical protein